MSAAPYTLRVGTSVSLRVRARPIAVGFAVTAAALALAVFAIGTGEFEIPPGTVISTLLGGGDPGSAFIVRELRLPRVLCALLVVGPRRQALRLADIHQVYAQRSDLEHFFRFGKQKLLLTDYQTPETAHEERWWQLAHLAYLQLWVARETATCRPRPWERSLPNHKSGKSTPTLVQRAFAQFIAQFGTPAKAPKPRGKSPGRRKGVRLVARQRQKVLKKDELPPV